MAGQGMAGQGRAGQGRAGQDRTWHCVEVESSTLSQTVELPPLSRVRERSCWRWVGVRISLSSTITRYIFW